MFELCSFLIAIVLGILDHMLGLGPEEGGPGLLVALFGLAMILPWEHEVRNKAAEHELRKREVSAMEG